MKKIIKYLFDKKPMAWFEHIYFYIIASVCFGFMVWLIATCS